MQGGMMVCYSALMLHIAWGGSSLHLSSKRVIVHVFVDFFLVLCFTSKLVLTGDSKWFIDFGRYLANKTDSDSGY